MKVLCFLVLVGLAQAEPTGPLVQPQRLIKAERLVQAGKLTAADALAKSVTDPRWRRPRAWILARTGDCPTQIKRLHALKPKLPWVNAEAHLTALLRAQERCAPAAATATQRQILVTHPHLALKLGLTLVLTPKDALKRALAFEAARDYPQALAALADLGDTGAFHRARIHLKRLRDDFPGAAAAFARLAKTDSPHAEEAAYLHAKALGRAGQVAPAHQAYQAYLKAYPQGTYAKDALFFEAFLDYESGLFPQAAKGFAALKVGSWSKAARWYEAWSRYLAGEPELTPVFDALAAEAKRGSRRARRAQYWAARALESTDLYGALMRDAAMVVERDTDWYALLIQRRFPQLLSKGPKLGQTPTPAASPAWKALEAEVRALAKAGFLDYARAALAAKSKEFPALLVLPLAESVGAASTLARQAMRAQGLTLLEAPRADTLTVWRVAFPRPFMPDLVKASVAHRVPKSLILSFIRKESFYEPLALSKAHAMGLMQLLQRTAQKLRPQKKTPIDLFDPAINIDIGTAYIARLNHAFSQQLPLVTAAYNAGPEPVRHWLAQSSGSTAVFVDRIPFKQTRGYVKKMIEFNVLYRILEGMTMREALKILPLTVLNDGPSDAIDF